MEKKIAQSHKNKSINYTPEKIKILFIKSQKHPFHLLRPSVFPIATSFCLFFWLILQVTAMHGVPFMGRYHSWFTHIILICLYATIMYWFVSILKESAKGYHTAKVIKGLRLGMLLFIVSEIMFFFGFFWAFFHYSLIATAATGGSWPPKGTQPISPWGLPFVNTLLLLTSGFTITVAHAYIVKDKNRYFAWYLLLTIILGIVFLICQAYEYKHGVKFSWRDNVYGSIFFVTTGFHGFHVTIGTLMLMFCWIRNFLTTTLVQNSFFFEVIDKKIGLKNYVFTKTQHFGFEASAWYWHFVDVVWLFLFITVYWWGGFDEI